MCGLAHRCVAWLALCIRRPCARRRPNLPSVPAAVRPSCAVHCSARADDCTPRGPHQNVALLKCECAMPPRPRPPGFKLCHIVHLVCTAHVCALCLTAAPQRATLVHQMLCHPDAAVVKYFYSVCLSISMCPGCGDRMGVWIRATASAQI